MHTYTVTQTHTPSFLPCGHATHVGGGESAIQVNSLICWSTSVHSKAATTTKPSVTHLTPYCSCLFTHWLLSLYYTLVSLSILLFWTACCTLGMWYVVRLVESALLFAHSQRDLGRVHAILLWSCWLVQTIDFRFSWNLSSLRLSIFFWAHGPLGLDWGSHPNRHIIGVWLSFILARWPSHYSLRAVTFWEAVGVSPHRCLSSCEVMHWVSCCLVEMPKIVLIHLWWNESNFMHTHTHMYTHIRTHTHTCTLTHTRTHTHIHTQTCMQL